MAKKRSLDKELIYFKLNDILDCLENDQLRAAKSQLVNLIDEIKIGVYDED
jgi:hypothetical protein|tara:strand:- start:4042 stop:4194 length:153 start_codon:yes stop_codon:yes gene_type:complete